MDWRRMMKALSMIVLASAAAHASPPAVAPANAAVEALRHCLTSPEHPLTAVPRRSVPPGLSEKDVDAVAIPSSEEKLSPSPAAGRRPGSITCGVALYGPVSPAVRASLRRAIEDSGSDLRPASPTLYKVEAPAAHRPYWGNERAPGVPGVLMLERKVGEMAPTIEVEYHAILVH